MLESARAVLFRKGSLSPGRVSRDFQWCRNVGDARAQRFRLPHRGVPAANILTVTEVPQILRLFRGEPLSAGPAGLLARRQEGQTANRRRVDLQPRGVPLAVEVFEDNTADPSTLSA